MRSGRAPRRIRGNDRLDARRVEVFRLVAPVFRDRGYRGATSASGGPAIDGVAGILQRIAAVIGLAWLALLGPALSATPNTAERAVPPPIVRAGA